MSGIWKGGLLLIALIIISLIPVTDDMEAETRGSLGGYFGSDRLYNSSRSLSGGMGAGELDDDN
jgi:hypothetical protein